MLAKSYQAEFPYLQLVEGGAAEAIPDRTREESHLRRSRTAVGAIFAILTIVLLLLVAAVSDHLIFSRESQLATNLSFEEITVSYGDSLWALASERAIDGLTTTEEVRLIQKRNHLQGALISAGQKLWVPDTYHRS